MSECKLDRYGTKIWFNKNGYSHRDDGPAIEYKNGTKFWYENGKLHRLDGPAIEYNDGRVEYYMNGVEVTEIEFFVKFGVVNE